MELKIHDAWQMLMFDADSQQSGVLVGANPQVDACDCPKFPPMWTLSKILIWFKSTQDPKPQTPNP